MNDCRDLILGKAFFLHLSSFISHIQDLLLLKGFHFYFCFLSWVKTENSRNWESFDQSCVNRERMFYESNESMSHESWVMSQWVNESELKNKSFGRNNKIKHYFYLICLLPSLLPAHARPISDMKSQPGLFVSSIPGPAATTTCMPWKIAFPDALQEPFKPSDNPYY